MKKFEGFEKGLLMLSEIQKNNEVKELTLYTEVCLCHFRSDLLATEFANAKREGNKEEMKRTMTAEKQNAMRLTELMRLDAKIGFETSNHYFYTERNLIEKIVRMENFSRTI